MSVIMGKQRSLDGKRENEGNREGSCAKGKPWETWKSLECSCPQDLWMEFLAALSTSVL